MNDNKNDLFEQFALHALCEGLFCAQTRSNAFHCNWAEKELDRRPGRPDRDVHRQETAEQVCFRDTLGTFSAAKIRLIIKDSKIAKLIVIIHYIRDICNGKRSNVCL